MRGSLRRGRDLTSLLAFLTRLVLMYNSVKMPMATTTAVGKLAAIMGVVVEENVSDGYSQKQVNVRSHF
jgi:hypothetical protein